MERKNLLERAERIIPLASHIAQVVVMLLTAGGLYFTVIPLYQKAALDEQVAKQQLKLEELQQRVATSYGKIRSEAVRQYVFLTQSDCTGLMIHTDLSLRATPKGPDVNDQTLAINVSDCMRQYLTNATALIDLTPGDREALSAAARKIAGDIDVTRLAAQSRLSTIQPKLNASGPLDLGGIDELVVTQFAIMKKLGVTDGQIRIALGQLSVNAQRNNLTKQYATSARAEIGKLNQLAFPANAN